MKALLIALALIGLACQPAETESACEKATRNLMAENCKSGRKAICPDPAPDSMGFFEAGDWNRRRTLCMKNAKSDIYNFCEGEEGYSQRYAALVYDCEKGKN